MSLTTVAVTTPPERLSVADGRSRSLAGHPATDPVLVAVVATGISAAGASRPSLWFDEAATISASTRSLPELWRLLCHIDAVHGLYYLMMHGWFAVFPVTEFWSRVPSCLAVGAAGAGVAVLGRQCSGRAVGLCAGFAFAILPRTTWAGVEARSYAFTALAAVWITVLLVSAVRRHEKWPWLLYALLLPASIVLNVFLVLLVPVHATALSVLSPKRSAAWGWAAAAAFAVAVTAPLIVFSRTESFQVAWISPLNGGTIVDVLQNQYFDHSLPFAIIVGVLIASALALRVFVGGTQPRGGNATLPVIAVAWMAIPTATLLLYTEFVSPIYYPRYLCFTAPAIALLMGFCIREIAGTPARMTAIILALAVAAMPNFVLTQRGPYKREGQDFSEIADVVTYHAHPGDCLLLDNTTSWKPGPIRPLLAARPAAYRKLVDLGRGASATSTNQMWDGWVPVWLVQNRLSHCTVLWTVSERDGTLPDHEAGTSLRPGPRLGGVPVYQIPYRMNFRIVERWQFSFAQITESVHRPAEDGGDNPTPRRSQSYRKLSF